MRKPGWGEDPPASHHCTLSKKSKKKGTKALIKLCKAFQGLSGLLKDLSEWQTPPFLFLTIPWWSPCAATRQVGLNTRFADMRKAFKYVDLDNSGTVDRSELERALQLWNVPMTKTHIDVFWEKCDEVRIACARAAWEPAKCSCGQGEHV